MDAPAMTGFVDTSLNLGLVCFSPDSAHAPREDPGRVANGVNHGGSAKREYDVSAREFERVVSEKEELETLLFVISAKYDSLVDKLSNRKTEFFLQNLPESAIRKRKVEYCSDDESCKRPRESNGCRVRRVYYRADASDMSLVVKDGYQWRKYGQKVTRDNPSPRAYFKCSLAPSCPVKKKVQRSVDNLTILVVTYEGEHNHRSPSCAGTSSLQADSLASFHSMPSSPTAKYPSPTSASSITQQTKVEKQPNVSIQQMATSLTRDPAFTSAIAAAISGTLLSQMLARTDRE